MSLLTTHHLYPDFPADLPTAPLKSISLAKLEAGDESTSLAFFNACRNLGFFYLDFTGSELGEHIISDVERLHTLQQKFYALPHEVKDQYGRDKVDGFYSYRWTACHGEVKDLWNRPGRRVSLSKPLQIYKDLDQCL